MTLDDVRWDDALADVPDPDEDFEPEFALDGPEDDDDIECLDDEVPF